MDKNKRNKGVVIGVFIMLFVIFVLFSIYAGTTVGSDIGEFIYNINHLTAITTSVTHSPEMRVKITFPQIEIPVKASALTGILL